MNEWLTFFSSVIHSLAWPSVAALGIVVLRREIRGVLRSLRRFSGWGIDATFGELVEELEEKAEESGLPKPEPEPAGVMVSSPRSAVIEAWLEVDAALDRLSQRAGIEQPQTTYRKIEALSARRLLPLKLRNMIESLRALRNKAVHLRGYDTDQEQAFAYGVLAHRVVAALDDIEPKTVG